MIEVKNLTKKFGSHTAVDGISFTVNDGEILGFLGPNGAGKTTTMNMMTGFISSTEGEVKINGFDILSDPINAKKQLGYLPDVPPLYGDLTVEENLKFVCDLKGVKKSDRKEMLEEICRIVHIEDVYKRLFKNLSKGYRQRVGLAQAILGYPEVIILDEPTVGLDPKQIIEIRDLIKSLKKKHTVILSSHILSEVSAVCDYVLIISHGKLVASDTPDNLGKLAQGSNNLSLLVKGDKDKIRILLGEIEGIKEIAINAAKDQEGWEVKLSTEENTDIRDEVFFKMAEHHYPILEMQSKKVSLEEIFLELTEDDKKKKPEEPEKEGETK